MVSRGRTELIEPGDTVSLTVTFRDQLGNPRDTDSYPQITIIEPNGNVTTGPTSAGVSRLSEGRYQFDFKIVMAPLYGVWNDLWIGYINGFRVEASFNFVVLTTQVPQLNTDGYYHLGDDPGFHFDQESIFNINKLLKTLRARLNSRGKVKRKDAFGNDILVNCDIFSVDTLVTFLANSITLFNEIPHFTMFTFQDTMFIDQFHDVLVEGAVLMALASQSLIEKGAETVITDSGINFQVPAISELLNTQYGALLTHNYDKIKFIKNSLKPHPIGMGGFTLGGNNSPQIRRLNMLRARRII